MRNSPSLMFLLRARVDWNSVRRYPRLFTHYTFTVDLHNGFANQGIARWLEHAYFGVVVPGMIHP